MNVILRKMINAKDKDDLQSFSVGLIFIISPKTLIGVNISKAINC